MSDVFFDGYTIGTVSGVQVHRAEPSPEQPVNLPTRLEGAFQATEVDTQTIAALMGLEAPVEAPKEEVQFSGPGFTGTLRNIAFHDDGTKDFPGTDGCVQMAMTMTGDLVDVAFDSPAKNRAWRKLKRRRMLLDCRKRWRTYQVTKDYRQLCRFLDRRTAWYARAFGVPVWALSAVGDAMAKIEKGTLWKPEHLEDLNTLRKHAGLPLLTEEDL